MPKPKSEEPPLLFSSDLLYGCMLLFPDALRIFQRVDLEPVQFYTLWYVSALGKDLRGKTIIPRSDLARELSRRLGTTTRKALAGINELHELHYFGTDRITPEEKAELFGTHQGTRTVVTLELLGVEKVAALLTDTSKMLEVMIESRPFAIKETLGLAIKGLTAAIRAGRSQPPVNVPKVRLT